MGGGCSPARISGGSDFLLASFSVLPAEQSHARSCDMRGGRRSGGGSRSAHDVGALDRTETLGADAVLSQVPSPAPGDPGARSTTRCRHGYPSAFARKESRRAFVWVYMVGLVDLCGRDLVQRCRWPRGHGQSAGGTKRRREGAAGGDDGKAVKDNHYAKAGKAMDAHRRGVAMGSKGNWAAAASEMRVVAHLFPSPGSRCMLVGVHIANARLGDALRVASRDEAEGVHEGMSTHGLQMLRAAVLAASGQTGAAKRAYEDARRELSQAAQIKIG